MSHVAPNLFRGLFGLIAVAFMMWGAFILWGVGGMLFSGGLFLALDVSIDEITERITNKTRYPLS